MNHAKNAHKCPRSSLDVNADCLTFLPVLWECG